MMVPTSSTRMRREYKTFSRYLQEPNPEIPTESLVFSGPPYVIDLDVSGLIAHRLIN